MLIGNKTMFRGVIYIATGKKYIDEAINSATSLKYIMPNMPVTIFSDQEVNATCFDRIELIKDASKDSRIYKISCMYQSPYEQTLFLDSDTYVCANFSEIFCLLDKFDLALAHDPTRIFHPIKGIPNSFPEMNSGVFLFRKAPQVEKFFTDWLSLYTKYLIEAGKPINRDQFSLRETLYNSERNLRIATLTPEYNCRFENVPYVWGEVKILHGRALDLSDLAIKVNQKHVHRVIKRTLKNNKTIMVYKFGLKDRVLSVLQNPKVWIQNQFHLFLKYKIVRALQKYVFIKK